MNHKLLLFALLLSLDSCVENLGKFGGTKPFFVINGAITNEYGPHLISLERTSVHNELPDLSTVRGARASIIDDLDQVVELSVVQPGEYYTPKDFRAEVGRSYRLEVELRDGEKIISEMEELVVAPVIDDFSYELITKEKLGEGNLIFEERFVVMNVSFCDDPDVDNYYKWEYTGTYQDLAYLALEPKDLDRALEIGWQTRHCWKNFVGFGLLQVGDDLTSNGLCRENVPIFEKLIDGHFQVAVYLELQQFGMTAREHKYLSEIKRQLDNNGTLFESGNYQIQGNLNIESDDDALVLGYFSVRAVSRANTFITAKDVFYTHEYEDCLIPGVGNLDPEFPFPWACYDCRSRDDKVGKENLRPDFWPK